MNKKYHYVYRITNLLTKKHYYGCRSSNRLPIDDLGIAYFSSSKDIDFVTEQKHHRYRFKYKVIRQFKSRDLALNFEVKLHTWFNVGNNPLFYNKARQTSSKFYFDSTGVVPSIETRKKLSDAHRSRAPISNETRKKLSKANSGKNNAMYGKCKELNPFYGKKHSPETKEKMSAAQQNRIVSEETKKKISNSLKGNSRRLGSIVTDETRKKLSEAGKGRTFSEESKQRMSEKRKLYWENKKKLS